MQYEHHCNSCLNTFVTGNLREATCPLGHKSVKRRFNAPSFHREFPEHFNHSVGQYVANPRELENALKKGADLASEDTGIEHRYAMADTRDTDLYGSET